MSSDRHLTIRKIVLTVFAALVYLAFDLPFRLTLQVSSVPAVCPASALPPVFGLLFGRFGALGCALGHLAADIISGYNPLICILGFAVQLFYGIFPYVIWRSFKCDVRLNSAKNIMRFMLLMLANSFVSALLNGLLRFLHGKGEVFALTTSLLFLNNIVFSIILGIPMILCYNWVKLKKTNQRISINERFIVIFLFLAIMSGAILGALAVMVFYTRAENLLVFWNRLYLCISLDLAMFSIVIVAFVHYAEKHITVPVEKLAEAAVDYTRTENNELNTKLVADVCRKYEKVHGEVGTLAKAFGEMAVNIEKYVDNLTEITAENERISAELNVAQLIQADMLPNIFPTFQNRKEFEIFASMNTAKEVGGDFYDFFFIDKDHFAMVIADVSGKGVPAALFMVISKTLIKNQTLTGQSPREILMTVNDQLCENNNEEMFVTVWLGILDLKTGILTASNAGHEYPVLCRAGGEYELVKDKHGFVLAGMEGARYSEYEIDLKPGDRLYVYTDGVAEATAGSREQYGTDRLLEVLNRCREASCEETVHAVKESIDEFVGDAEQFDDITMISFKYMED